MRDGSIKIDTEIDTKGIDKGLNSVKGKVNNLGKDTKGLNALKTAFNETGGAAAAFTSKMGSVASSGGPAAAAITASAMAAKKYIETLKKANEAYKVQEKAEKALSKAAENNPYLNNEGVERLKDFAGEIQKVSNYGDEGTIDIMAQLAATGRNEAEIMKTMAAAADYAAAKHIDLKTAAETLNSTYSGMAGTMGRQIVEIKDLTDEQLKNGDAIDLIAKKYKGLAADAVDSSTQSKNAFGDFMESVGKIANPTFEELNRQSTSFWEDMTKKMDKFNDKLKKLSREWGIGGIHRAVNEGVDLINTTSINLTTGEEKRGVDFQNTEYLKWLKEELELRKELKAEEQSALAEINIELKYREGRAEREKKAADAEAKAAEEKKRNQDTIDYIKANTEARKEALAVLELTAASENRSVTAEEKLSVFASSYVDLITKSEGKVTKTNEAAKSLLETTIAMSEEIQTQNELKEEAEKIETKLREALDDIAEKDNRKESEKLREQIKILEEYYLLAINNAQIESNAKIKIEKEFLEKKKVLLALETEAEEIEAQTRIQNRKEMYSKIAEIATRFTTEYAGIMSTISEMATEQINNEAILKTDALEKEYAKGEMSAEDYEKKLLDIKREAANEKYKIDMWVWASNIAAAIASSALGVAQALADPTIASAELKIGLASLIGLAGAVQLSSILSNKPIPPQFATGGVVPGSSYTGDKMIISTNSAERVLTAQQNAAFEKLAFGQTAQSGPSIKIYNSASNDVSAKPEMSEGEILIMIEKTVSKQMESGKYNSAFKTMQGGLNGVRYTN